MGVLRITCTDRKVSATVGTCSLVAHAVQIRELRMWSTVFGSVTFALAITRTRSQVVSSVHMHVIHSSTFYFARINIWRKAMNYFIDTYHANNTKAVRYSLLYFIHATVTSARGVEATGMPKLRCELST